MTSKSKVVKTADIGNKKGSSISLAVDVIMQVLISCKFNPTFLRHSMYHLSDDAVKFLLLYLRRQFVRLTSTSISVSQNVSRNISHVTGWISTLLEAHAAQLMKMEGNNAILGLLQELASVIDDQVALAVEMAPLQGDLWFFLYYTVYFVIYVYR